MCRGPVDEGKQGENKGIIFGLSSKLQSIHTERGAFQFCLEIFSQRAEAQGGNISSVFSFKMVLLFLP